MEKLTGRLLQVAFWICVVSVLYLALAPMPPVSVSSWDKVNHVVAFATLGLLGLPSWPRQRVALVSGLVAYGCAIEILQSFTPTRQADWHDVVADAVGVFAAFLIWAPMVWVACRGRK